MESNKKSAAEYWSRNIAVIVPCLVVWALVSLGAGIVFAPLLNNIHLGGYPLGFWFAQQGAIYIFIILIFFYAWRMNKLDKEMGLEE